ncbi:MAG TPA: hypothetical protein VJQ79_09425 [Acidimicrobiia bacterium]|nr:hypothetical protein [Acidimicrobiia bacterium]
MDRARLDKTQIDGILIASEAALATGARVDLAPLGFWKAVNAVKKQPGMVEVFADRIGEIDRLAFERWALLKLPGWVGTSLAIVATAGGSALVAWSGGQDDVAQGVGLLVGTGIVLTATHSLAHWLVARLQGMTVLYWFVGSVRRPTPGIKVDYATYVRTPARQRAWMHASGAIVSKVVPLVGLGVGWAMDAPTWALISLGVLGVGQIVTDVLWSTKSSDWKKFNREMALARVG